MSRLVLAMLPLSSPIQPRDSRRGLCFFEPHDFHSEFLLQISRTLRFILLGQRFIVPLPIKFDNDATFSTMKVDDIRTDALLTTEPLAEQLPLLKEGPKDGFRSNRLAAQFFSAFREFLVIEWM